MRPSFVRQQKPFLVSVISESDPESAIAAIRNSECDGANAMDLHLDSLEKHYHNANDLRHIIRCTDKPIMLLNFRRCDVWSDNRTDEDRVESLLKGIKAGASACDIMGDLYAPSPLEITYNEQAVGKQKKLIDTVHSMGGEVVLSSHTQAHMSTAQVVEHMKALESRGADMVKIVVAVNSDDELAEAFATTIALKKEMKVPFIHICMGQYGKIHRFVAPTLGSALIFCVQRYTSCGNKEQPLIRAAKAVLDNLDWHIARSALGEDD